MAVSTGVEGIARNIIVAGTSVGGLVCLSAVDLQVLAEYRSHRSAVTAVSISFVLLFWTQKKDETIEIKAG